MFIFKEVMVGKYKTINSMGLKSALLIITLAWLLPVASAEDNPPNNAEENTAAIIEGLGRPLSHAEINALNSHIFADGTNLPEGQGSVVQGRDLYNQHCASCHGGMGEGGAALELVGDRTLLSTEYPDKGIAVYWPYAPTLFQYIQRAMPPDQPGSFNNNELYSLVGYVLFLNDLLPENAAVQDDTLATMVLPNRDGFVDQTD